MLARFVRFLCTYDSTLHLGTGLFCSKIEQNKHVPNVQKSEFSQIGRAGCERWARADLLFRIVGVTRRVNSKKAKIYIDTVSE